MIYIIKGGTTGLTDGTIEVPGDGDGVTFSARNVPETFHLRAPAGQQNDEQVSVTARRCKSSKDGSAFAASAVFEAGEIPDRNVPCSIKQTSGASSAAGSLSATPRVSVVRTSPVLRGYRKRYTINTTAAGADVATTLLQFGWPVIINSTTWPDDTERGHFFDDAVNAAGKRVRFLSSSGVLLDYEVEYYDSATQEAVYWVRLLSVAGNSTTAVDLIYGYDVGTDCDDRIGTWPSFWKIVQHLGDNSWGASPEAKDSTVNAFNAVNTNSVDAAGIIRRGRQFNNDGMIQFQSASAYKLGAKTWSISFKTETAEVDGLIDNCGATAANRGASVYISGGKLYWYGAKAAVGNSNWIVASSNTVNDGVFHRGFFTWDGTTGAGKVKLQIDGVDVGVYDANASVDGTETVAATNLLALGKFYYSPDNYKFSGVLDEFREADYALPLDWGKLEYWSIHKNADCSSWAAEENLG